MASSALLKQFPEEVRGDGARNEDSGDGAKATFMTKLTIWKASDAINPNASGLAAETLEDCLEARLLESPGQPTTKVSE